MEVANRCPLFSTCRAGGSISSRTRAMSHARSCGERRCRVKYWLHPNSFDIVEDFEYNCTPRLRREVRQIIFEHFDRIVAAWRERFGGDRAE